MVEVLTTFWHWFVVIPVLLGLLGCAWLVWANSRGPKDQTTETVGHVWDEDLQEYNNPLPRWWLNLFYITLVFAVVYLALYPGLGNFKGLLNWTQFSKYEAELAKADRAYGPLFQRFASQEIPALAQDPEAMSSGARLFATYCTTCHGSGAHGAKGFPSLADKDWLYGGEPAQIKTSILDGRAGIMPAWQTALGDDGVLQTMAYVRSLAGEPHDEALAKNGKVFYTQMCAGCHGPGGDGTPALGAPRLNDDIWLYGNSPTELAHTIANGRNGRMPPHREFLGEDKVHLLAAYVWSLSNLDVNSASQ